MKLLRKVYLRKTIALTLLILFLQSIFIPTINYALTHGAHQPEYTSYEEPGATDMVDLLTGDFSFRLPIIDIPGPDGGFSMPLSYKAGIGLDQESTWTGLGWSLNPGAIARNIVEYPDDASGETFMIHRANDDIVRGWNARIPGVGQIGWNNNTGHYGRISILGIARCASYENGSLTGYNQMGVDFTKDGVTADPVAVASAVVTVATLGGAGAASTAANVAANTTTQVIKDVGIQIAAETAFTLNNVASPGIGNTGYWKLSKT